MDSGIDIRFILGVLRRRLWIMLAVFSAVSALALALAVLLPPVYRAEASLLVESQKIPSDLVRSTVSSVADERLQIIKQRITTRVVLLEMAKKFNLFPEERSELSPSQIVSKVRSAISIERYNLGSSRRGRRGALVVGFKIAFEDRNPQITARVVSELVIKVLSEDAKARTSRASDTTKFLESASEKHRRDLAELDANISAFRLENDAILPEKRAYHQNRFEKAKAQIDAIDRRLQTLEDQKRFMQLEMSIRKARIAEAASSGSVSPSRQLRALKAELLRKNTLYTDSHPDIVSLNNQITALEREQEAAAKLASGEREAAPEEPAELDIPTQLLQEKISTLVERGERLKIRRKKAVESSEEIIALLQKIPAVGVALNNLKTKRRFAQNGLGELAGKLNQARLGERLERDQQAESFQILEQPVTPTEPIKPNRPIILAGGLASAAGAALAIVLLLEFLNRSVRTAGNISRSIGQPPLATIPYLTTSAEQKRQRRMLVLGILTLIIVLISALVAVQLFYLPLDEVYFKVLKRFGLN